MTALALSLALGLSLGQVFHGGRLGLGGQQVTYKVARQASAAAFDFMASGCGVTPVVLKGGPITVIRSTAQNYVCADGLMRSVGANQLAVTERGAQVFPAGTNSILNSEDFSAGSWTTLGGGGSSLPVVTVNQADAPNGTHTADRVDFPAVSGGGAYSVIYTPVTTTAMSWDLSVYVKGVAGVSDSGVLWVAMPSVANYVTPCSYISTAWTRCDVSGLTVAGSSFPQFGTNKTLAAEADTLAQSVYLWGAQMEAGDVASPYQPTGGSPVSWPGTLVTTSIPLTTVAQARNSCLYTEATMPNWNTYNIQGLLSYGGSTNAMLLSMVGNGVAIVDSYDATPAVRRASYGSPISWTGQHSITGCVANGTTNTLLLDGRAAPPVLSGAGTGIQTLAGIAVLGNIVSGGYAAAGYVSRAKICSSSNPQLCRGTAQTAFGQGDAAVLDVTMNTCGVTPSFSRGGPLTVARSSTQYYPCNDGLHLAGTNQLPITEKGAQIWAAGTNYNAQQFSGGNPYHVTAVKNATDPTGAANSAATITDDSVVGTYHVYVSWPTLATHPASCSAYMKQGTSRYAALGCADGVFNIYDLQTCTLTYLNAAYYLAADSGAEALGATGWCRVWAGGTWGANYDSVELGPAVCSSGAECTVYNGNSTHSIIAWGKQYEAPDVRYPSPYQPTAGTAVSWPGTIVTAPSTMSLNQVQNFCMTVDGTTASWATTNAGGWDGIMSLGTSGGNNTAYIVRLGPSQTISMQVSGGNNYWTRSSAVTSLAAGSSHKLTGCASGPYSLSLTADGAWVSTIFSGTGGPLTAAPSSFLIGAFDNTGNTTWNGYLTRAVGCVSSDARRCQ